MKSPCAVLLVFALQPLDIAGAADAHTLREVAPRAGQLENAVALLPQCRSGQDVPAAHRRAE